MSNKIEFMGDAIQNQFRHQVQIENSKGQLHLRLYISSHQKFSLAAFGLKEVVEISRDTIIDIPNVSPLFSGTINLQS